MKIFLSRQGFDVYGEVLMFDIDFFLLANFIANVIFFY